MDGDIGAIDDWVNEGFGVEEGDAGEVVHSGLGKDNSILCGLSSNDESARNDETATQNAVSSFRHSVI